MGVETLGDLMITSGVDTSGLASGLDDAKVVAGQAADAIAASFSGAQDAVSAFGDAAAGSGLKFSSAAQSIIDKQASLEAKAQTLKAAVAELQAAYDDGAVSADTLQRAQNQLQAVMDKAYPSLKDAASATQEAGEAAGNASERVAELAEGLVAFGEGLAITEGLKEFVTEALSAVDAMQRATNSLTALTGGAEQAEEVISSIEKIAATQPFSFPELAGAAQRMAAFGIESDKIPTILQDAANTSRATGNSFDAIVSALGRVDLAGQVSARQLVQLGLSWDDLAKAAGKSVEDTQALLKKGGQDAADDLDLVLKAVEAKFGGFAQVPLSIGEQWKVLENQMHSVFADIGAALLPVIQQMVDLLQTTLVPALKSGIELFNSLPAPIKDGVVAFGLLVAAAAPVSLAIGGITLGLNAIGGAVQAAAAGLAALGISAGGATASETALAAAEEADAVAAGHAAAAHKLLAGAGAEGAAAEAGMATNAGLLGGSLATVGLALATFGGAIAVTISNINQLKQQWSDTVDEFKSKQILDAINSGATLDGLKKMGVSVDDLKKSVDEHNKTIDYAKIAQDNFVAGMPGAADGLGKIAKAAKDAADGYDNFGKKVIVITGSAQGWSTATQSIIDKHGDLEAKLQSAQIAVQELTKAQDGSAAKAEQLALAQQQLKAAQDALTPGMKDHIQTVDDLAKKYSNSVDQATKAQAVYDKLNTLYKNSKIPLTEYVLGLNQLMKAYGDAYGPANNYELEIAQILAKHQEGLNTLDQAQKAFDLIGATFQNSAIRGAAYAAALDQLAKAYDAVHAKGTDANIIFAQGVQKQKDLEDAAEAQAKAWNKAVDAWSTSAIDWAALVARGNDLEKAMNAAGLSAGDLDVKLKLVGGSFTVIAGGVAKLQTSGDADIDALNKKMIDLGASTGVFSEQAATFAGSASDAAAQIKIFGDESVTAASDSESFANGVEINTGAVQAAADAYKGMTVQTGGLKTGLQDLGTGTDEYTVRLGKVTQAMKDAAAAANQWHSGVETFSRDMLTFGESLLPSVGDAFTKVADQGVSAINAWDKALQGLQDHWTNFANSLSIDGFGGGGGSTKGGKKGSSGYSGAESIFGPLGAGGNTYSTGSTLPAHTHLDYSLWGISGARVVPDPGYVVDGSTGDIVPDPFQAAAPQFGQSPAPSPRASSSAPVATGSTTTSATASPITNFLNTVSTALSGVANSTLPAWLTQLQAALKGIDSTNNTSTTSLPDWVTQLSDTVTQFMQQFQGTGILNLTAFGDAVQSALAGVPNLTNSLQTLQQSVGATASFTLTQAASVTQAAQAAAQQVQASFAAVQALTNPAASTAAVPTALPNLAGFAGGPVRMSDFITGGLVSGHVTTINNVQVTSPTVDQLVQQFVNQLARTSYR